MPEGQVLEFSAVTKRFGAVTAVDAFTARVEPGRVTGFLGPNGAGKTTTLRVLLGLVRPSAGTTTIGGVPYAKLAHPLQTVGAVLEASSFHPGRTAANHLKVYAQAAGLPASRVDEALGLVGLADVAGRKVGGYSLGMKQRLGLAYALLGDPGVLVLDEPANGLDPEGIKWMRGLLRDLARQGRTVLVSSHLLAEVQQTVDSLLIIATGRLVFQGALEELTDPREFATVVDSPDRAALAGALSAAGVEVQVLRSGLIVRGLDPAGVGRLAADAGIPLSSLQRRGPALEEVFLDLVNGARVHVSAAGAEGAASAAASGSDAPVAAGAVLAAAALADDSESVEAETHTEADAEAPGAAGFAVAGTGVIDIIPAPDESSDPSPADEPVEAEIVQAGADADEDGDADTPAAHEAAHGEASDDSPRTYAEAADDAADEPAPVEAPEDTAEADVTSTEDTPAEAPHDVERPWEEYIRTDADEEADRFFSSFDADRAAAAADANAAAAPEDAHTSAESEAPADHPGQPPLANADADAPPVDPGHADDGAAAGTEPIEDVPTDEPHPDTGEFGTIADLSPDWSTESGAADPRDADDHEGGESR